MFDFIGQSCSRAQKSCYYEPRSGGSWPCHVFNSSGTLLTLVPLGLVIIYCGGRGWGWGQREGWRILVVLPDLSIRLCYIFWSLFSLAVNCSIVPLIIISSPLQAMLTKKQLSAAGTLMHCKSSVWAAQSTAMVAFKTISCWCVPPFVSCLILHLWQLIPLHYIQPHQ